MISDKMLYLVYMGLINSALMFLSLSNQLNGQHASFSPFSFRFIYLGSSGFQSVLFGLSLDIPLVLFSYKTSLMKMP